MPDGFGGFLGDKDHTAAVLGEFARSGWLNIVGGCCGTTPEWISAIARAVEGVAPRKIPELAAPVNLQRHGAAGRPAGDELPHDRRADQYHRLEAICPLDQERRLRVGPGRRARTGRGRGQYRRRQHGRRPDRRREGHDPIPEPDLGRPQHRQGPDHDRQLEVERHRGRAQMRARASRSSTRSASRKERQSFSSRPGSSAATARRWW